MAINKPVVIDIYHGDAVIDPGAVKGFGILGVIHKAWEGGKGPDPLYDVRRKMFTDLGLKWGAYAFFHGKDKGGDPIHEADSFLAAAEPDASTLIALDWEEDEDGYVPRPAEARAFLERIIEKLGRKARIYSGNVAKEQLGDEPDEFFGGHRLWLCQYAHTWRTQASWQRPWLWQNNGDDYGPGPNMIPGIKGLCDNNTIVDPMTVDDLLAEWAA